MVNINIKDLLGNGEMVYDTLFTEGTFEWFKSNEDDYIYVRNTETGRCSRYNAEAQNGKRIPADVYESNKIRAKTRLDEENGDDLTEEMIENALREFEESQTTEETKQIAKEFAPKKRTRKSKDITFAVTIDGVEIALTAKQVDFIRHLPDICFWENGLDSALWTDVLADEIGGQFAGKPMTTGAMISTLCEKGLSICARTKVNGRTATSFELTNLGKVIAAELGLN